VVLNLPQFTRLACLLAWLAVALPLPAQASDDVITLPDVIQGAQQWAQQNLDTNVLAALPAIDPALVNQFYAQLQARLQGNDVVDVAALRDTARTILPLLESRPETRPYAAWLKAQMDYLDVAEEIRQTPPPPTPLPPTNAPPVTPVPPVAPRNPPPAQERALWIRHETGRPWPAGAKEYVAELKPVFVAANVPPALVWVAEVESSFDREAQSPAGAAGLFQLMPDTARRFGLSLWPRDQRYQAVPSARASAEYFKYLYDRFADWRLVMAAYNAGEGTIERLLAREKAHSFDAIAGHLPAETQMYVPRIEAVMLEREGSRLETLAPPGT
jgi:membrane-bound lytic murein transglycosylase D